MKKWCLMFALILICSSIAYANQELIEQYADWEGDLEENINTIRNSGFIHDDVIDLLQEEEWVRVIILLKEEFVNDPECSNVGIRKREIAKTVFRTRSAWGREISAIVDMGDMVKLGMDFTTDEIESVKLDDFFEVKLHEAVIGVNAPDVWDYGLTGKGQTVCVIDSGIDLNNPEVVKNYAGGYDFIDDLTIDEPQDFNGHGTYVSSIVTGIAPDVKIVAVKVFDDPGSTYESTIIGGIQYCMKEEVGADIILMAFGGGEYETTCVCDDNEITILANEAAEQGIFVVAASGDDGKGNVAAPSCGSNVVSVGTVDDNNKVGTFTDINPLLDLLAPGTDITATTINGKTMTGSGTSASAAVVAGIAALILEGQDMTPEELRYRLKSTGNLIEHEGYKYSVVNAKNALNNEVTNTPDEHEAEVCEEIPDDMAGSHDGTTYRAFACNPVGGPGACNDRDGDYCRSGTMYQWYDFQCTNADCGSDTCQGERIPGWWYECEESLGVGWTCNGADCCYGADNWCCDTGCSGAWAECVPEFSSVVQIIVMLAACGLIGMFFMRRKPQ